MGGAPLRHELRPAAFPEKLWTELYPVIEEMQVRLGDMNDLATSQARLCEKIERA
jgi:hypothetical protein